METPPPPLGLQVIAAVQWMAKPRLHQFQDACISKLLFVANACVDGRERPAGFDTRTDIS